MQRAVKAIEILLFCATVVLAVTWYRDPTGNWEPLLAISFCATAGIELLRRYGPIKRADRFSSNAERLKHRERLRQVLQDEIYTCKVFPPGSELASLTRTTRAFSLGFAMAGLRSAREVIGLLISSNEEKSDRTALLVANVPYDSIAEVNLDGDEYYNVPHIYCHFDFSGQPYEHMWFAERKQITETHPYFKKIADYDDVERNNPTDGNLYFC